MNISSLIKKDHKDLHQVKIDELRKIWSRTHKLSPKKYKELNPESVIYDIVADRYGFRSTQSALGKKEELL